MIVIKCAKCRAKVFKYLKVGKGRILHCWKERIIEEYITLNGVAQSSARGAKVVQLSSENDIPNNNVVTFGDFVNSLPN